VAGAAAGWVAAWVAILLLTTQLYAQTPPPSGYFRFPLLPGQRAYLSGSFAELRPNHFHAGIDVKTGGREGIPVQAAAGGYVSRVVVSAGGYGNAVFVSHPNGYVTVYAHLQRFSDRIGAYVRERQYRAETFEADVRPEPKALPVTPGEVLGLSGNSGGSAGPHLHFEIRNDRGLLVDPQQFRFPEIVDDVPPVIEALALRPLGIGSRLNGTFDRQAWEPIFQNGQFTLSDTLTAAGELGLELLAYDRANGTPHQNGLHCVEVLLDGVETHVHRLEGFSDEVTRDINVHTDYATARLTSQRFQRCYRLDGNDRLPIYNPSPTRGRLRIGPGLHRVTVNVWDSFQNKTSLSFWVNGESGAAVIPDSTRDSAPALASLLPTTVSWAVEENTLIISAYLPKTATPSARLFFPKNGFQNLHPAYRTGSRAVYLWDLRRGLPDSVHVDGAGARLPFVKALFPGKTEVVSGPNWRIEAGPRALYDTLYLTAVPSPTGGVRFGPVGIPFREALRISLTPTLPDSLRPRSAAYANDGYVERHVGGNWQGNTLTFSVNELNAFLVKPDTTAPTIRLVQKNEQGFRFKIGDDWSGIRAFRATVDSRWVLMNYDSKTGLLWSEKRDSTVRFSGPLALTVTDNSGNTANFSGDFSQPFPAPNPPKKPAKRKRR
jgi:hypothetical protein